MFKSFKKMYGGLKGACFMNMINIIIWGLRKIYIF